MSDLVPLGAEAAANTWLYAAVLLAVGVSVTRWWLRLGVRSSLSEAAVERLEHRLADLGLRVAIVVAIALAFRMWAHTIATFGWWELFSWDRVLIVAARSRWGHSWQVQMMAAVVLIGAHLSIRTQRRSGWLVATLASVGLCGTLPFVGHAAGSTSRVLLHGLHVLGAGLWLGTLTVVLVVSRPSLGSDGGLTTKEAVGQAFLRRFSPIAFSGMTTLVVTGAVTAWLYVGSLTNLWATSYGRVLSAKILLFLSVGICGWFNWRQFSRPGGRRFPVVLEVSLAAGVVVLTGLLSQLEHP